MHINSTYFERTLQSNLKNLTSYTQKLSTGKRINSASDDASGLQISTRMTAQNRGNSQAIRNIQDGISLLKTADGNISTVQDQIQRIRELTIQYKNGTYSAQQKEAIENEVKSILENIGNTTDNMAFNGKSIKGKERGIYFDGIDDQIRTTNYSRDTQAAAVNTNFTYEFWVKPFQTQKIDVESNTGTAGTNGQNYAIAPTHGTDTGDYAGVGVSVGTNGITVYEHKGSYMPALLVYEAPITEMTHVSVVYNNNRPSLYINGEFVKEGIQSTKTAFASDEGLGGYVYGSFNGILDDVRIWNYSRTEEEVKADMDNDLSGTETGLYSNWKLDETSGTQVYNSVSGKTGSVISDVVYLNGLSTESGKVKIHNSDKSDSSLTFELPSVSLTQLGLIDLDLDNSNTLMKLDSALNVANTERGKLGSLQNRFEFEIENLQNTINNTEAAQMRIEDLDMAGAMSELTKSDLLMKTTQQMLKVNNSMYEQKMRMLIS